ncbi:ABC transporter permease [Phototrophicus methaneseepsis]|uniref:ABC transporter permease n=1 Tax=Phototrophicus methaneseepsis TaxID=2710758 RepID=A0A7S8EBR3_9CHLR|nr:ABC transporter permease [Phototrophicus methaneseepsis]QPC83929.1 ABC transporter permease [Phototrophicus methaneseepsis]
MTLKITSKMTVKFDNNLLVTIALIVGLLALWEGIVTLQQIPVYIVPAPSRVLTTLFNNLGYFADALLVTVSEALIGLFIGTSVGVLLASLLSLRPNLERGIMTLAVFVKSTPLVAIAPLLTIWLGFGMAPKIILTALLTFFPVLVNVFSGLSRADVALLDTLRSWHASRWEIFWHVRMPGALPYLFAALKISGPLSLIGAVVAEWTGASQGIGKAMWLAYSNLNMPYLFAAIFILAFVGQFVYSITLWLERRFVFWQPVAEA